MEITHEIVSMIRKNTKSGNPMWECTCKTGERVWVVQHSDMRKDTLYHFAAAGFGETLSKMTLDTRLSWKQFPIRVALAKDGEWWRLLAVDKRIDGQEPDSLYEPDREYWRKKAKNQAALLINRADVVCFDTETTGVDADAEIISIAVINARMEARLKALMKPRYLERVAATSHIHGITADELEQQAVFVQVYATLANELHGRVWLGYNVKFDIQMLDQECERKELPPIAPAAVVDVMELVAWWRGDWDAGRAQWKVCKLVEAAQALGVEFDGAAHDAFNDTAATMRLVWKMAGRDA